MATRGDWHIGLGERHAGHFVHTAGLLYYGLIQKTRVSTKDHVTYVTPIARR